MSVRISGKYLGNKKVELVHEPSEITMKTDAPKDNYGEGTSFSPTDLVAASLGSCIMTVVGIVAEREDVDLSGMRMEVVKSMTESPRKIASMPVTLHLPKSLSADQRKKFEHTALTCPIHRSLHPEISAPVEFCYDVE